MVFVDGSFGGRLNGFRVRIYDELLECRVKLVTAYQTADKSSMMYHVEGTSLKCTVRNTGDGFTFFSSQVFPNRQFFAGDTSIEQVVCAGFNAEGRWLVPDDKEQLALF